MNEINTMWPLDPDSSHSHCIAGRSIRQHLQKRAGNSCKSAENAWLSIEDIELLTSVPNGRLVDSQDRFLASIGSAEYLVIAKSSFLILHPWHLIEVAEDILSSLSESDTASGEIHPNAVIEGNLQLGTGSRILPGVYIEGNVTIGNDCKIGPNCYIRGNTSIGNNCHIGQSVEVKNSVIGNSTNIGHLSYVGDTIIGNNANLGAGTITSNFRHDGGNHRSMVDGKLTDTGRRKFGSILADGVHTGINTSIYPGRKIGKNGTTVPAEVVRQDIHT